MGPPSPPNSSPILTRLSTGKCNQNRKHPPLSQLLLRSTCSFFVKFCWSFVWYSAGHDFFCFNLCELHKPQLRVHNLEVSHSLCSFSNDLLFRGRSFARQVCMPGGLRECSALGDYGRYDKQDNSSCLEHTSEPWSLGPRPIKMEQVKERPLRRSLLVKPSGLLYDL